jgi:aspartyl-tRNA(Asn)/glutamyl-tRNA(Gln) amidotransferase subunit C
MIDKKAIEHIAKLARLHVSDKEAEEFSQQLSKALGYFEQISKVDTQGVEPLVTPSEMEVFWREDVNKKELSAEELVANAPEKVGNLFKVPPVV